jgi:hypothetical protein
MKAKRKILLMTLAIILVIGIQADARFTGSQVSLSSTGTPPSELIDWTIHDKGNIRTAIFNWGLMGGYSDVPSGEWPKNSGRNYLAEIQYWMGAVLPNGDTVVANTDDDFLPEPNFASSENDIRIRVSTDDDRYEYDLNDTVGLGQGNPAYGWRTYDLESGSWVYNQIYDPITQTYHPGGPIALQESQYIMNDARLGSPALGLLITQTVYQWNYSHNKDYLFVVLSIKNISENDYSDFAFGLYCDFDIGGWYDGENGRLGDLVAFDSANSLAWTYDEDNYDAGWGPTVVAGRMGTKYIETPGGLGMTSFRTGQWENLPTTDEGRYEMINSEQFDDLLPPTDQFYIQSTRGIDLPSGEVVRVVYALIAGQTDKRLLENSLLAQMVYENHFTTPEPPEQPVITVTPGENLAKISWDRTAENSVDPLSGVKDFNGYKIYRSNNRGSTWGELTYNADDSRGPDYIPIAIYRKDETSGLIQHTYIDSNLINGFEYWYAVTAFDTGDETINLAPQESAQGTAGSDPSAASIVPRSNPAGYFLIQSTLDHQVLGSGVASNGTVAVELFDDNALNGSEYKVIFTESIYETVWHLINLTTSDTLLVDQLDQNSSQDEAEIVEGLTVLVQNSERVPRSLAQTEFSGADTTITMLDFFGSVEDLTGYPSGGDKHFRSTYEFRFTETGSVGYWWWDDVTPVQLPFEVWNTTFDHQVQANIVDYSYDQVWNPEEGDIIMIVNVPYDNQAHPEAFPWLYTWSFRFDTDLSGQTGDVFTIEGAPLNSADDEFYFSAPGIDAEVATEDLADIKVVPNPYIARAAWEFEAGEHKIEFINLPDKATVRIYTLGGDLVRQLEHDNGSGTACWDIESVNEQSVAPGVYFYHVQSPYGEKIGKFAIIK